METRSINPAYCKRLTLIVLGVLLLLLCQIAQAQTPAGPASEAKKEADQLISEYDKITDTNARDYASKLIRVSSDLERNKEFSLQAYALAYAAMAFERSGDVEAALTNYEKSTKLFLTQNIPRSAGLNLRSSARILASRSDYKKAIESLRESLSLLAGSEWEATVCAQLGNLLWDSGDPKAAIPAFEKAIELFKDSKEKRGLADAYASLGILHSSLNNYDPAVPNLEKAADLFKELKEFGLQADNLFYLAIVHTRAGRKERSWPIYEQAIELFTLTGQNLKVTNALNGLGASLADSGQHQKAVGVFERAAESCKEVCDDNLRSTINFNLGSSLNELKRTSEALRLGRESIESFRKAGNKVGLANALNLSGFALGESGDHAAAIELQSEAASLFREIADKDGLIKVLYNLGVNYAWLNQHQKSLESYSELLGIVRTVGLQSREGEVLFQIGLQYDALGNKPLALKHYKEALVLQRQLKDRWGEGGTLAQMGILYNILGDVPRAMESYQAALKIAEELKDKKRILEIQAGLAFINFNRGDYTKAAEMGERLLQSLNALDDKQGVATMLTLLASVHSIRAEYARAIELTNEALKITRQSGWKMGECSTLSQLGMIYLYLGSFEKAEDYTNQSLKIALELKIGSQIAIAHNNLGLVYMARKNYDKALEALRLTLTLQKENGNKKGEMIAENNLANALWGQKKFDEARGWLLSSLAISRAVGDRNNEALCLLNLGALNLEDRKFPESLSQLNQALRLARELGDRRTEAFALGTLADYWRKQENPEVAVFFGKEAVNIIQGIRSSLTGFEKETQGAYIRQFEEGYREFANLLIDLGRISEAEKVLAMLKEQEYFDFVRRDGDVVDELLAKVGLTPQEEKVFLEYKKHADRLTQLGKELGELQIESRQYEIGKFPKQARLDELEEQISNANKVFFAFLDQLKTLLGEKSARVYEVDSGLQAMLRGFDEPRSVIISTISGKDRLSIILTTPDVQKAYTVKTTDVEVNRMVSAFIAAIRSRTDASTKEAGKKLFDALLPASLLRDLENVRAETILWSLDGTLRYVPMNALWDGERYLIERFNNVVLTLASRDKLSPMSPERKNWNALGAGVTKSAIVNETDGLKRTFSALPAVANEICGLVSDPTKSSSCATAPAGEKGVMNGRLLIDEDFTLRNLKNSMGRFPVIHIASHFHLNSGNENDSYLLLGGGEENRLTLRDIREAGTQFAGVELLTLSACNTATFIERGSAGVEIEGFGALAQKSGAKTVVASLWAVSDNSTKELMVGFYRNLLNNSSEKKGESLRKAQLSLLRGEKDVKYSHPYYWAPFVLIGNWR